MSKEMVWWGEGEKQGSIIHQLDFKVKILMDFKI